VSLFKDRVPNFLVLGYADTVLQPQCALVIEAKVSCFATLHQAFYLLNLRALLLSLTDLVFECVFHPQLIQLPLFYYLQTQLLQLFM
jgi:hypothetical protein